MFKKTVAFVTTALLVAPGAGVASERTMKVPNPLCVPLPVSTSAKDIHVGEEHVHLAGRTNIRVCATTDHQVGGTPTVTAYDNCGTGCFAARVADVSAAADLKVEVLYKEDDEDKAVAVDPDPIGLGRETEEICISNHDAGTPDPCTIHLTSPSDLRATGGAKQVTLRWKPGGEAYGRDVVVTYEVWRSTTTELDTFEMVGAGVERPAFVDTGLTKKTRYWYFVVAVDENGNRSCGSNAAEATTD